jgi:hypothetical protein
MILKGGKVTFLARRERLFVGVRLKRLMLRCATRIALSLPQEEYQEHMNKTNKKVGVLSFFLEQFSSTLILSSGPNLALLLL